MKAYRITSTEYHLNQPSVFLFVNGIYYGDLSYPRLRNFPQNIDYWETATCADSDRYFTIEVVDINDEQVTRLASLHSDIEDNSENFIPYTTWRHGLTAKEREADIEENKRREELNRPFYQKLDELNESIFNIIAAL